MKKYLLILAALMAFAACAPDNPDTGEQIPEEQELSDEPLGNVKVKTGDPYGLTESEVSFICTYSGAPSTGVKERGVRYGTQADNLSRTVKRGSSTSQSGSFMVQLGGLEAGTRYFYQAFITVWDGANKQYVDIPGIIQNFITLSGEEDPGGEDPDPDDPNPDDPDPDDPDPDDPDDPDPVEPDDPNHEDHPAAGLQYLNGYEIPAVTLSDYTKSSDSGNSDGPWWTYYTPNEDQRIVTHAFTADGKQWRNWTALIDKTKQAPLWSAFIMHNDIAPRSGSIGRGKWHQDPALPAEWQSCFASGNYHRGHLVANGYRQKYSSSRNQTFYYTNQALQEQNHFNGAIWEQLENKVRSISPTGTDTLYVVVGLLYEGTPRVMDGKEAPSHFYKLLMYCGFNADKTMKSAKGVAYLMENDVHSDKDYDKYTTSIDAIEQRTGFDFFTNVPKTLQDAAEKTSSPIW